MHIRRLVLAALFAAAVANLPNNAQANKGTPDQDLLVRVARGEFEAGHAPQEQQLRIGTPLACQVLTAVHDNYQVSNATITFQKQGHIIFTAQENAGECTGYQQGYTAGYNAGFDDGYDEGYDEGYDDGYDDGWWDCKMVKKEQLATIMRKPSMRKPARACTAKLIWENTLGGDFTNNNLNGTDSIGQAVRVGSDGALYFEVASSTTTVAAVNSVRDPNLKAVAYWICH